MPKRVQIVLPEDLLTEVDRIAGKRQRSRFIEAAIRDKLARAVLTTALRESAGSLDLKSYPEWETPEKVSAWVRSLRGSDRGKYSAEPGMKADAPR